MSKIKVIPEWREVKPFGNYVYIHTSRSSGFPFYVGVGSGKRAWECSADKRSSWWINFAGKYGVSVCIVQSNMQRSDALLLEMWLIAKFRHEGLNLVNMTDGGDGCTGHPCADSSKMKISIANGRPVFSSRGEYFKSSVAAADAIRESGIARANHSTISSAARGDTESAYGRAWWFEGEVPKEYVSRYRRAASKMGRPVVRSDGAVFDTAGIAARFMADSGYPNAHSNNILAVAKGRRPTAYGYKWEYV